MTPETGPRWAVTYKLALSKMRLMTMTVAAPDGASAAQVARDRIARTISDPIAIWGVVQVESDHPCHVEWLADDCGAKRVRNIGAGPVEIHTLSVRRLDPGEEFAVISGPGVTHRVERAP